MDETNTDPGNWTLPLHEERPRATGVDDLCLVCDGLLHKIIYPARDGGDEDGDEARVTTIGWIDRMAATEYCVFCHFLVRLFLANNEVTVEDPSSFGSFVATVATDHSV